MLLISGCFFCWGTPKMCGFPLVFTKTYQTKVPSKNDTPMLFGFWRQAKSQEGISTTDIVGRLLLLTQARRIAWLRRRD